MEIRAVSFQAFKSLYDVSCEIDHFTVITGPNGAGKSNFVDGLNFLSEIYEHGLEYAVSRAGGYENIAHRRSRRAKTSVRVSVEVVITYDDLLRDRYIYFEPPANVEISPSFHIVYKHSFAIRTATQQLISDFKVVEDRLELLDRNGRRFLSLMRDANGKAEISTAFGRSTESSVLRSTVGPLADKRYQDALFEREMPSTALVTDQTYFPNVIYSVRQALGATRVFQLSPYQCRGPGVPTPNADLERHGENLPGAADHLRRNDPRSWGQVEIAMKSILPDLTSIDIAHTEDRRLTLQFRTRGAGRAWSTEEISDGTIQAFALFLALYDRRSPLLVIEEPENSVHPWILRKFIDHCREAHKQILLTSHSPVLLNYVDPRIVRLMSMHSGRSRIEPLLDASADFREAVLSGDVSLFDVYDSGAIYDALPRGFTPSADLVLESDESI